MPKHIKTKPMREIEKAAKNHGLKCHFVNCKKHVQVFINDTLVLALSNNRVDQTHNHRQIFSIIAKMATA